MFGCQLAIVTSPASPLLVSSVFNSPEEPYHSAPLSPALSESGVMVVPVPRHLGQNNRFAGPASMSAEGLIALPDEHKPKSLFRVPTRTKSSQGNRH